MSAVGLLLGAAAFLVLRTGDEYDRKAPDEDLSSGVGMFPERPVRVWPA